MLCYAYIKNISIFANYTNNKPIYSFRHAFIPLISNDTNFYYLFGFINENSKYIIQKHIFNSIENFTTEDTLIKNITINNFKAKNSKSGISCFQTEQQFIICFFLTNKPNLYIVAYDTNLEEVRNLTLNSTLQKISDNPFYKCLHLEGEIGLFTYYNNSFPVLIFLKYDNNSGFNTTIPEIILNKTDILVDDILLNDIIKINEKKIYFCCKVKNKNYIYIISIYLYKNAYKKRYYFIDIQKYGSQYKIHLEMRIHNYNNFLAFAFSHESDTFYNSLLIFSYPNSTDNNVDLIPKIFQVSNNSDIFINLENEPIRIENNIFGYIFSGISIYALEDCDYLNLISSISNNTINPNYNLKKNESIKLSFNKKYSIYNEFMCNLQYSYKITEPNLECYDKYPKFIDGDNEINDEFEATKEEYIGRLTYYNISLNESLTRECEDTNCELCLQNNPLFCVLCKYNSTFSKDNQTKICLDQVKIIGNLEVIVRDLKKSKEELIKDINDLINSTDISKYYYMKGEDYNIIIRPTNSTTIRSLTHVDFEPCEDILRAHYNIPKSRIITFLQLEIDNLDSQSAVNQVGYQAFDDERNPLNLSLCNNTNIQIFYLLKSNSSLDILFISSFKDSNINLFNIDDEFFTDICFSYSYSENDVVLEDRIKDFYQNYSLCDNGCTYNDINIEYMTITCDCNVTDSLETTQKVINLKQIKDVDKSSIFEIIRCYNLVFSLKNKLNNIGFWIFLFLTIAHVPLLIIYFSNGLKQIKTYLIKEMIKYGYISKKNVVEEPSNKLQAKSSRNNLDKLHSPPRNNNNNRRNITIVSKKSELIDSSSTNKMRHESNKVLDKLNNIVTENENSKVTKNSFEKVKTKKIIVIKRKKKKNNSFIASTQGDIPNDIQKKRKKNLINLSLININVNNPSSCNIAGSNHVLNVYTFEEAVEYDMRSYLRIYYIYLLAKQAIFHAFLFKSPLELFPLRLCLLIFIISSDLALNALFYFDDKISEKYRYTKGLLLFAFSNNITVILLSTAIGFILLTLFIKLSNAANSIRKVFKEEEKKLKKDKKYVVTDNRKVEIFKEIQLILKRYKIKVIIFIVIELILMLFFWYYVTAFCHVYPSTQKSWLWDSFLSILTRIVIDLLFCLGFAKLYRLSVDSNINCIYKIAIFFYSFS